VNPVPWWCRPAKPFGERLEQVRRLTAADASTARATLDDIAARWAIVQRVRVEALDAVEQGRPVDAHRIIAAQEPQHWKAIRKALDGLIAEQQRAVTVMGQNVLASAARYASAVSTWPSSRSWPALDSWRG